MERSWCPCGSQRSGSGAVRRAPATAKLNLALVVGPRRGDGRHEVVTVLQRLDLADRIAVEPAPRLRVEGFPEDRLVGRALESLAAAAGVEAGWEARIWKRIPVAAGLGGGSSDAATALRLANETLPEPLPPSKLQELAAKLGADVPFFLASGPQLGEGVGADLTPLDLPQDYWVVLLLPHGSYLVRLMRGHRPAAPAHRADRARDHPHWSVASRAAHPRGALDRGHRGHLRRSSARCLPLDGGRRRDSAACALSLLGPHRPLGHRPSDLVDRRRLASPRGDRRHLRVHPRLARPVACRHLRGRRAPVPVLRPGLSLRRTCPGA